MKTARCYKGLCSHGLIVQTGRSAQQARQDNRHVETVIQDRISEGDIWCFDAQHEEGTKVKA